MALKDAPQCTAIAKRTGKKCQRAAVTGYSVCRVHGAGSKNKPGGRPPTHGRYSTIKREAIRSLIEKHEADPDPLNIMPELAAGRALFQDFIERYDQFTEAIVAWHASYQSTQRPISREKANALVEVVDQYAELIASEDDLTDRQQQNLEAAKEFARSLTEGNSLKPIQILDISDAYRIVSEITKIVERIERIRAANAVSRPDLARIMQEMARVVSTHITDEQTLEQIKNGWLSIRI